MAVLYARPLGQRMHSLKKPNLQPQLVPKPLWGISARRKLGRGSWQHIRQDAIKAARQSCEICGESPNAIYGDPLTCHEVWRYDDILATATLLGFEIHCPKCDLVTHMGRAMAHGFGDDALDQLCRVNGTTRLEAKQIYTDAMALWQKRSVKKWRVKVAKTLLRRYPQLTKLETGKTA